MSKDLSKNSANLTVILFSYSKINENSRFSRANPYVSKATQHYYWRLYFKLGLPVDEQ